MRKAKVKAPKRVYTKFPAKIYALPLAGTGGFLDATANPVGWGSEKAVICGEYQFTGRVKVTTTAEVVPVGRRGKVAKA